MIFHNEQEDFGYSCELVTEKIHFPSRLSRSVCGKHAYVLLPVCVDCLAWLVR